MKQVVCALIINRGKLLITQHGPHASYPLKWEFPGGKIAPGETPQQALTREIMEELEIEVVVESSLSQVTYTYPGKEIQLYPYLCRINGGTLRLTEHHDCQWINPEDVLDFDLLEADLLMLKTEDNFGRLLHYCREKTPNQ